jgi:hypothetical protein
MTNRAARVLAGLFGVTALGGAGAMTPALVGVTSIAAATASSLAVPPEPDAVPKRWQLDCEVGELRVTTVETKDAGAKAYFYLTYRVVNNSTADQLFAPAFDLMTDDGRIIRSGREIPADVTKHVLGLLDEPLLLDQIGIIGPILQGKENSKRGVVIWPADQLRTEDLTVFAAGFSGETRAVTTVDAATGKELKSLLRKTLLLRYKIAGDFDRRGNEPYPLLEQRWILR